MKRSVLIVALLVSVGAAQERQIAIQKTAEAISAECPGDWGKCFDQMAPFRAALAAVIDHAIQNPRTSDDGKTRLPLIAAPGDYPMFTDPPGAGYLSLWGPFKAEDRETWLRTRSVATVLPAVQKWLAEANIDLIVVPVPKMAEVYPDRIAEGASLIAAPHMRELLLNLLRNDVEVVDLLPEFLKAREHRLYYPIDPHWAEPAERIAAKMIVDRLKRYPFVQAALKKPAVYKAEGNPTKVVFDVWDYLSKEERAQLASTSPLSFHRIVDAAGNPFAPEDGQPILVIGDSYSNFSQTHLCKGTGVTALIAKGINQRVSALTIDGGHVHLVKELIRNPEMLQRAKVVIWIMQNMTTAGAWQMGLPTLTKTR